MPKQSQFSLEAENEMLKEQLKTARTKISRLRHECRRLNRAYNLTIHATKTIRAALAGSLAEANEPLGEKKPH